MDIFEDREKRREEESPEQAPTTDPLEDLKSYIGDKSYELSQSIDRKLIVDSGLGRVGAIYYSGWATSLAFGANFALGRVDETAHLLRVSSTIALLTSAIGSDLSSRICNHVVDGIVNSDRRNHLPSYFQLISEILDRYQKSDREEPFYLPSSSGHDLSGAISVLYKDGELQLADCLLRVVAPDARTHCIEDILSDLNKEDEPSVELIDHLSVQLSREWQSIQDRLGDALEERHHPTKTAYEQGQVAHFYIELYKGNLGKAEHWLNQLSEQYSYGFFAGALISRYWNRGDREEAKALLERVYHRSNRLRQAGEDKKADVDLRDTIKNFVKYGKEIPSSLIAQYEDSVIGARDRISIRSVKIVTMLREGEVEEGIRELDRTLGDISEDPSVEMTTKEHCILLAFESGEQLLDRDPESAKLFLLKCAEFLKDNSQFLTTDHYLPASYVKGLLRIGAISEAEELVRYISGPSSVRSAQCIAQAYAIRGDYDTAESLFVEALESAPSDAFNTTIRSKERLKVELEEETGKGSAIGAALVWSLQASSKSSIPSKLVGTYTEYAKFAGEVGLSPLSKRFYQEAEERLGECQPKERPFLAFKIVEGMNELALGFQNGRYPYNSLRDCFKNKD